MQFADILYIAYIIMLYILIAICCLQCMSAYINSLDIHHESFFFSFLFYIGVELVNYAMLVSEVQQGDSVTCIYSFSDSGQQDKELGCQE